jgi:hypothetical protein
MQVGWGRFRTSPKRRLCKSCRVRFDELELTDGADAGSWIEPGLEGEFGAVTLQVPKIFEAYARVFHPAADVDGNPASWTEVAEACGTTPHGEMQWHAIIGQPTYQPNDDSKWPGQEPSEGEMDIPLLDALCEILTAHTTDPNRCFFGLCTINSWGDAFSKAELRGHRLLKLPLGRDHIVLAGPLSAVDQILDERGSVSLVMYEMGSEPPSEDELAELNKPWRAAPHLIWPTDHSWLVVTEVDFDSTLVGGSTELVEAIVASPKMEAWRVEPATSLAEGADKINVPSQTG